MNSTDSDRLLSVNGEDANDYEDGSDLQQTSLSSSHCHSLIAADDCRRRACRSLQIAAVLSAAFIIVEFVGECLIEFCVILHLGGLWANSLAIVTDAGHMLSDLLSFVISLIALRLSRSAPTKRLSFGFDRVEVLAALASVAIIWILTAVLVYLAVLRVVHHDFEIETVTMMVTAAIGGKY
jgi:zinc transporter 2